MKDSGFKVFLVAVSSGLAFLVLVLARQNHALKEALARQSAHSAARFEPGESVPPLSLLSGGGRVEALALDDGRRSLVLFYAESCTVCPQVFLSWEELAPQFAAEGVRLVGVQLDRRDPASSYAPPGIASFALADLGRAPLAKIATVPLTLLVDGAGRVEWAHYGTLTPGDMAALVAFLPVTSSRGPTPTTDR